MPWDSGLPSGKLGTKQDLRTVKTCLQPQTHWPLPPRCAIQPRWRRKRVTRTRGCGVKTKATYIVLEILQYRHEPMCARTDFMVLLPLYDVDCSGLAVLDAY